MTDRLHGGSDVNGAEPAHDPEETVAWFGASRRPLSHAAMCFSAEADATMGIVIGVIAIDSARHVRDRSQLPLAALPVVLAVHQLMEVFVWWGLDGIVARSVGHAAVYAYLAVAYGIPLLVPRAVASVEPDDARRRVIEALAVVAAVVAVVLLAGVATGPVGATDAGDHIAYSARLFHGGALTAIYVVSTLGCLLISSHRFLVVYGLLNLVAVGVLAWLTASGFVSLWCAWAAVTSIIIAMHLRATTYPAPSRRLSTS